MKHALKHDAQRYQWFDLIRGLSALAVCASHLRNAMLQDYSLLPHPAAWQKVFYFLTSLGHEAVMVFFVLSGFFVGGAVLKRAERFTWRDYLTTRLTRLWVVLLPALAFTCAVDVYLSSVQPTLLQGTYRSISHSGPPADGSYSRSLPTLLGNVAFLQTIVVPTYGTLDPAWSLSNEFWYYLLFPLLAASLGRLARYARWWQRALCAALALAIFAALLPVKFYLGFLIWVFGVVVWWLDTNNNSRVPPRRFVWPALALLLGALAYAQSKKLQDQLHIPSELPVGFTFALLALAAARAELPRWGASALAATARGLSEFSYSLYLCHFPIVMLLVALVYPHGKLLPDARGLAQFGGWLVLLCLAGVVFYWCFERHTPRVRALFRRREAHTTP